MFGLSENNDKNDTSTNGNSADGSMPQPPLVTGGDSSSTIPAPPVSPSPSTSTLPSDPSLAAASAELEKASNDASGATNDSGSMSDVNLGNAYIANDPLNAKASNDSSASKPTAAALLNNTPEEDLIKLKQQALQSLAPLVDHLDQSAEEKFKTTMMLIQASDNAELIQEAYDAANKIEDEKVRAQALLDVVNEINYFTQHSNNSSQPAAE
jgi:hypothetical protein